MCMRWDDPSPYPRTTDKLHDNFSIFMRKCYLLCTKSPKLVFFYNFDTFFIGEEIFWGQDRLEFVDRKVARS